MLILLLSLAVAVLDQATKYAVSCRLLLGEQVPVLPGLFSISHVHNTGAAWGIFAGQGHWLVLLSIAMLGFMVWFRHSLTGGTRIGRVALALMLSGIIGNLIDRVKYGYVVDFLHFYWRDHAFPSFNVADAAICTGVGLYLLVGFLTARTAPPEAQVAAGGGGGRGGTPQTPATVS